jgi:hypothetical protein
MRILRGQFERNPLTRGAAELGRAIQTRRGVEVAGAVVVQAEGGIELLACEEVVVGGRAGGVG